MTITTMQCQDENKYKYLNTHRSLLHDFFSGFLDFTFGRIQIQSFIFQDLEQ